MTAFTSDTLQSLLAACARRDEEAFEQLYRATSAKLFAVALRILRNRTLAEEVLQESYVSIWQHAGNYRAERSAPMTWLTSIVRNRALDVLRRPQPEDPESYDMAIEEAVIDAPSPLESLQSADEAARLVRCLDRLDERQRRSIVLAFFQGLTHIELAKTLQTPLGTVKTWVRRGLQQLKSCLEASGTAH